LESQKKTGWFIIPELNPDGMELYKSQGNSSAFYIDGRVNINNIDLNRNFCTQNFESKSFVKNGLTFQTARDVCSSEKETQVIGDILRAYNFTHVISIHSQGNIFFLPDGSFDAPHVRQFAEEVHMLLPNYNFDISYRDANEKKIKIRAYEIDEGGSKKFTGTMETYIYEAYNIPVILIELPEHGVIDTELRNLAQLFK